MLDLLDKHTHTFCLPCLGGDIVLWKQPGEHSRLEQGRTHYEYSVHKYDTAGRSDSADHLLWSHYHPKARDNERADLYPETGSI